MAGQDQTIQAAAVPVPPGIPFPDLLDGLSLLDVLGLLLHEIPPVAAGLVQTGGGT